MGASFGAIEVAIAASAEEGGSRALVGPLLAAWALGSMLGGLLTARGQAPADPRRRLAGLLAATAVADGLVALAPGLMALGIALFLAGACIAPAFATLYSMVADLAREGTLTESYTWLTTGIAAGAAGSAAGGALVDAVSTHAAIGGAAAMVRSPPCRHGRPTGARDPRDRLRDGDEFSRTEGSYPRDVPHRSRSG